MTAGRRRGLVAAAAGAPPVRLTRRAAMLECWSGDVSFSTGRQPPGARAGERNEDEQMHDASIRLFASRTYTLLAT